MLRTILRAILVSISTLIRLISATIRFFFPPGPFVTSFSPQSGWGGTTIVINGAGFDPTRDGNAVMVAGFRALVLEAAVNRLRVVTHQDTVTGPVRVTIAGNTITSASNFQVLPHPDQGDITQDGPPRTFVGPQPGTPTAKSLNQKVLAILVYPSDQDPGTPTDRTNKRNEQISRFNDANRFYQEATFGATSFQFDSTDWLALPQNRDFYIWQADDIFRARRSLYRATRVDIKINGAQAYLAHWQGFTAINISNPSSLSPTGNYALVPPIPATAIHSVGGQAYVGYGTNGIHILNIPASGDPTEVGSLPEAAWVADLDFSNNILYVAAEDQGLHVINATTSPAGIHSLALPDWAMGVRVSGSYAYVATGPGPTRGAGLVVVDVHDPSNLTTTGTLSFGGEWAVAIDLSGTIAYVATDGDGIKIVDITNSANPTLRSTDRTVLRPRGLAIVGTTLYVAAADQGLRILNVSNPDSPSEIGHLDVAPAFSVAVSGSTAYVALGAGTIQAVDVTDPAHPSSRGSYNATSPGTVVPLDTLRNQLDTAIASQGFLQRNDAFLADSFQAAQGAGFDLSQYQGFIIVQHGPFLRGQSWTDTGIPPYNGVNISFGGTRGLIYLAYDATWGRRAHEIGHWLGLGDVYQDYHPDGTYTLGTAGPWDLMGEHDGGPLFSGFHMDKLQYFNPSNVVQRTWTLGGPAVDETFAIVAHDRTENTDAGKTHLLQLQVAEGLIYFIEVRQRPGGPNPVIFDASIPVPTDMAHPWQGGVIITKALDNNNHANMEERYITLLDTRILDTGDEVIDAARELRISIGGRTNDRPLTYQVRLQWNQPVSPDPNGRFDLYIAPWTTDTYTSIDVWVDSLRNNPGVTPVYEFHQDNPPDQTIPRLIGDRPWVHHANTIYGHIHNSGMDATHDVYVSFYTTSPPGIGDNGSWVLRETKHVNMLAPNSDTKVTTLWIPAVGEHTCIKVDIAAQIGEVSVGDNLAQENVAIFDSAGSSSHQPVEFDAAVRNPFPRWQLVFLQVRGLPVGWSAVVDHSWVWVAPRGEKPLKVVIWTIKDTPEERKQEIKVPVQAFARVEGWTTQMHRLLPIGGLTAIVNANRKVQIEWRIAQPSRAKPFIVTGCIVPPLANVVNANRRVSHPQGKVHLMYTRTNANGCFQTDKVPGGEPYFPQQNGQYKVQVFVTAGGDAAEMESEIRSLTLTG